MPEDEIVEETTTEVIETTEEDIEVSSESDILDDVPGTEEGFEDDPENIEGSSEETVEESIEETVEETTEELSEETTEELTEELIEEIFDTYFGHRVYYNSAGYPYYFDENGDRIYISDTENIVHAGENMEESTEDITDEVETIVEVPFLEKDFTEYSTSEALLLLIFIILLLFFVKNVCFD